MAAVVGEDSPIRPARGSRGDSFGKGACGIVLEFEGPQGSGMRSLDTQVLSGGARRALDGLVAELEHKVWTATRHRRARAAAGLG